MEETKQTLATRFSLGENIANSITHLAGALLSVIGIVVLILQAIRFGDVWHITSYSIFGGSLLVLYLASGIYHSFPSASFTFKLEKLDHAAIYLLIAGTYTPFLLTNLRGVWGWTLFGIVWGLTIVGVVLKFGFNEKFQKPTVWLYVAMGWIVILAVNQLLSQFSMTSLVLLAIGGVLYTSGIIFYRWEKLPYNHAIWHLFVLGGSTAHFFSVLSIV